MCGGDVSEAGTARCDRPPHSTSKDNLIPVGIPGRDCLRSTPLPLACSWPTGCRVQLMQGSSSWLSGGAACSQEDIRATPSSGTGWWQAPADSPLPAMTPGVEGLGIHPCETGDFSYTFTVGRAHPLAELRPQFEISRRWPHQS